MAEENIREISLQDEHEELQLSHPIIEGPQSQSVEGLYAPYNLSRDNNDRATHSHLFGRKKPDQVSIQQHTISDDFDQGEFYHGTEGNIEQPEDQEKIKQI